MNALEDLRYLLIAPIWDFMGHMALIVLIALVVLAVLFGLAVFLDVKDRKGQDGADDG